MKREPIQIRVPIISDKQNCCPYEEPFGYIYKITNKVSGNYYIGQHEFHHPWLDKSYKGSGIVLNDAYNSDKYSYEDFETIILEWTNEGNDKLNELEIFWIDVFNSYVFPQHYNLTEGGSNPPKFNKFGKENHMYGRTGSKNPFYGNHMFAGKNHPLYGKYMSEESKQKLRQHLPDYSGINNPMYGKTHTEETKKKQRRNKEETKKKQSELMKGKFTGKKNHFFL